MSSLQQKMLSEGCASDSSEENLGSASCNLMHPCESKALCLGRCARESTAYLLPACLFAVFEKCQNLLHQLS